MDHPHPTSAAAAAAAAAQPCPDACDNAVGLSSQWMSAETATPSTQHTSSVHVSHWFGGLRRVSATQLPFTAKNMANIVNDFARQAPSLGLTAGVIADLSLANHSVSAAGVIAPMRTLFSRFDSRYPHLPRGKPTRLYRGLRFAEGPGHEGRFSPPSFHARPFMDASLHTQNTDMIAIFTNGMRQQARNIYRLVYALNDMQMREKLTRGDLVRFFAWAHRFRKFFIVFMVALIDFMLPSIRKCVPFLFHTPGYFSREGMRLCELLKKVSLCERPFTTVLTTEMATRRLCWIFNDLAQPLLTYVRTLDEYFTVMAMSFASQQDLQKASVAMVRGLQSYPNFSRNLGLILSWLPDCLAEFREDWIKRNVSAMWRVVYRKMERASAMDREVEHFQALTKSVSFY